MNRALFDAELKAFIKEYVLEVEMLKRGWVN